MVDRKNRSGKRQTFFYMKDQLQLYSDERMDRNKTPGGEMKCNIPAYSVQVSTHNLVSKCSHEELTVFLSFYFLITFNWHQTVSTSSKNKCKIQGTGRHVTCASSA